MRLNYPETSATRKWNGVSGFEASAFDYGGKFVVAYAGTNTEQYSDLGADGR